ncbi:MAG TPA: glycogen debranching N-terminal domain-containing protein [Gemmatimonadaceae bacterium]|nr:glycogen debranching N-terminal domain-containing protein [Gemmatimonadaceae bacterium]
MSIPSIRVRPEIVYAWRGESVLIVNLHGECGDDQRLSGYYFRETRYLRTLRFAINGERPWVCDVATIAPDVIELTLIYPEIQGGDGGGSGTADGSLPRNKDGIESRSIDLRLRYRVGIAALDLSLRMANRSLNAATLDVAWSTGADYAGLEEAQSGKREQHAAVHADGAGHAVRYRYACTDLPLETHIHSCGAGRWHASEHGIGARVQLAPNEEVELALRVEPKDCEPQPDGDGVARRDALLRRWTASFARIAIPSDRTAERTVHRAIDDLASFPLLRGAEDEWLAVQAGVPLYPALFGRDSTTTAWQAAMLDRGEALDHVLTRLERLQGARVDPWRDEQPGRMVHSVRQGPADRVGTTPFARYYGDFASPLMYVIAIAHLYAWTGDRACITRHRDAARRALDWAREYGDADGDGYLEYDTRSAVGPKNQGWKDSGNGIVYEDGRVVSDPIETCELQGYWFAAQQLWAVLSWILGEHDEAKALWRAAMALKARFNREWWVPAQRCFALARDADERLVTTVSSNAGQCIATGIVDEEHLPALVGRLFAPDMFSGWGIRTLSSEHVSYNPLKYHLGSVWPVENATIALGLRRYGFDERALEIAEGTFALAELYGDHRVPECVGGYARWEHATPGTYPQANSPQAWNQSAVILLLHTMLGLQPIAALDVLVTDPVLPEWMRDVVVRDLRVGGATVTLRFRRDADATTHVDVLERRGTLHVVRQPPPESLTAGVGDRLAVLATGLLPHWRHARAHAPAYAHSGG